MPQTIAIEWYARGGASWFLYRWEADEVLSLEEYVHVVREHGPSSPIVGSDVYGIDECFDGDSDRRN